MEGSIEGLSCDELCDYIIEKIEDVALADEMVICVRREKLDGSAMLSLTAEEIKEAFPTVGVRNKIKTKIIGEKAVAATATTGSTPSGQIQSIGSLDGGWVEEFEMPCKFSKRTMNRIRTGRMNKNARVEIVAAIYTRVMHYTEYPTPAQYSRICWRLVEQFPILTDKIGNGIGTWKEQLKQKFRNGRRVSDNEHTDDDHESPSQPSDESNNSHPASQRNQKRRQGKQTHSRRQSSREKRRKVNLRADQYCGIQHMQQRDLDLNSSNEDQENDQQLKQKMVRQLSKRNPKEKKIEKYMAKSYPTRRTWILSERPGVDEVVTEYPALKKPCFLKAEMMRVLELEKDHDFTVKWKNWRGKLMQYGRNEQTRKGIKEILQLTELFENNEDWMDLVAMKLLQAILAQRAKTKIVHEWLDSVNLETEVVKLPPFPSIIVLRSDNDALKSFIAVEKAIVSSVASVFEAIIILMSVFFVYDMEYPPEHKSFLIFVQRLMLNIEDSQNLPNSVKIIYSAMIDL